MIKSHKIKLNPTQAQMIFFKKSCGVARFAYNWALNEAALKPIAKGEVGLVLTAEEM